MNVKNTVKDSKCANCLYSIKDHIGIDDKIIFCGVRDCSKIATTDKQTAFTEKDNCQMYTPCKLSAPQNETEQKICYVSRQIDEVCDMLTDILGNLTPD